MKMVTCGMTVNHMYAIEQLQLRKLGTRAWTGVVIKFDMRNLPSTVDVLKFRDVEDEIRKNTTLEIYEAYERAVRAGDTLVICHYNESIKDSTDIL